MFNYYFCLLFDFVGRVFQTSIFVATRSGTFTKLPDDGWRAHLVFPVLLSSLHALPTIPLTPAHLSTYICVHWLFRSIFSSDLPPFTSFLCVRGFRHYRFFTKGSPCRAVSNITTLWNWRMKSVGRFATRRCVLRVNSSNRRHPSVLVVFITNKKVRFFASARLCA